MSELKFEEALDRASGAFVTVYPVSNRSSQLETVGRVEGVRLSFRMQTLDIAYRSLRQQRIVSATYAPNAIYLIGGNPSASIVTTGPLDRSVTYRFDRESGLVGVGSGNIELPEEEIRPVTAEDYEALDLTEATRGILDSHGLYYVLTPVGIGRLAMDIQSTLPMPA